MGGIWNDLLDFFQKRLPPEIFLSTFQETESVWIIILLSGKKDSLYAIDTILPHFFPRKNSFCFLAVGTVFSLDRSWHAPYLQTVHGLNMRYFQKKTFMLLEESEGYSSEEQQSEINVRSGLTKLRQKLVLLINTRNEAEFTAFINEMFDNIQKNRISENCICFSLNSISPVRFIFRRCLKTKTLWDPLPQSRLQRSTLWKP